MVELKDYIKIYSGILNFCFNRSMVELKVEELLQNSEMVQSLLTGIAEKAVTAFQSVYGRIERVALVRMWKCSV